jgi:hypothetical protein
MFCRRWLSLFYIQSPCNFLIEAYSKMSYTICKSVPSFRFKNRIRWSNSRRIEAILLPTVSGLVCLGIGHPPMSQDRISISVILGCPSCGTPSLTRRLGWNLLVQVVVGLCSAVNLRSNSCRTNDYNCPIWDWVLLFRLVTIRKDMVKEFYAASIPELLFLVI